MSYYIPRYKVVLVRPKDPGICIDLGYIARPRVCLRARGGVPLEAGGTIGKVSARNF